jgi:hypothetical protein
VENGANINQYGGIFHSALQVAAPYGHKTGVIPVPGMIQEPGVNPTGNRRESYPKNRGETVRYRAETIRYSLGFPPVYQRDS